MEDRTLWMEGGLQAPAEARRCIDELVGDQMPHGRHDDLRLLVSELVTNSVRHGGARASDRIAIELRPSADRLRVEITDFGPGFIPPAAAPVAELRHPGGLGLVLVDRLSTRWGVDCEDVTRVWFELSLA